MSYNALNSRRGRGSFSSPARPGGRGTPARGRGSFGAFERGRGRAGRGGFNARPARAAVDEEDGDLPPQPTSARRATADEDSFQAAPAPQHVSRSGRAAPQQLHSGSHGELRPTRVLTTTDEHGSELPRRLNNKIFIDGLPYQYNKPGEPSLEDELMQFALAWKVGKPLRLIKRPGQGFGFLVFQSPNSVATAVRVLNGRKFLGRALRVEEPKPKDMERLDDAASARDAGKDSFNRQVLLSDLAKTAEPDVIREVLRDVAPQLEKKLESIKMTSRNRKAFLTFVSPAEVEPALTFLDGFHLLGRRISATRAAAPGSLPYSRGGAPLRTRELAPAAVAANDRNDGTATAPAQEAESEEAVVPLGMEVAGPATTAKPAARGAAAKAAASTAAPAEPRGSNVTGQTERYNLLDKGSREIFVGNLGDEVTEDQLRAHFAPCGRITACTILVHPETHLSSGIARLEFALPAYAAFAQSRYHGSRLHGTTLRVDRGDEASAPLAAELPSTAAEDEYDEAVVLRRYGVKDKAAYFAGTSLAKEMGAEEALASDSDEEVDEVAAEMPKKKARTGAAAASRGGKKAKATAKMKDDDDDDDIGFVTSGMLEHDGGSDSDEEHFYDADQPTPSSALASKPMRGTKTKGRPAAAKKTSGKRPRKQHN